METIHSLDSLKHYQDQAAQFFAAELMLLKEVVPNIEGDRLAKRRWRQ